VRPGQLYKRKLPEELTRDMVGFSAVKPQERQRMILQEVSTFSPFYSFVCALTNFGDKFLRSRTLGQSTSWSLEWSSTATSLR
jgi:hypothetical protein